MKILTILLLFATLFTGCLLTNQIAPPAETISGMAAKKEILAAASIGYYWGVYSTLDSFQPFINKEAYLNDNKTLENAILSGISVVYFKNIDDHKFYTNDSIDACMTNIRNSIMILSSVELLDNIKAGNLKAETDLSSGILKAWDTKNICNPNPAGTIIHVNHLIQI